VSHLLAIDQGTTSTRSLLFDASGRLLASAQREFSQSYPQPGWVEHDPQTIWRDVLHTARGVIAKSHLQVAAIGIANQRETTIVWERADGTPIYPAIVWQDRRTAAECERLRRDGAEALVRARTGLLLDPYFSATKLAWILDHVAGARARAERGELAFGTVDSFLLWHLTGGRVHATDATNASRTMLFDIHRQCWDGDLLRLFNIPEALLAEVHDNSFLYGITAEGLFDKAIPVAAMAIAFTSPGNSIELLDGQNLAASFSAFVHAPFKDDSAGERNETSLALQIALIDGPRAMRGLFLGDLAYTTLRRVVDETKNHGNHVKLVWNALLAPHHCSKKAMYEKDANGNDVLRQDILDDFEAAQVPGAFIIASSPAIPESNSPGDNPPHAKARHRYEEIVSGQFLCTGEYSTPENMRPIFCRSRPTAVSSRAGPSSFRKKPGRALRPQWRKHAATVPRQRPRSASGAHDHGGPTVGPFSASGDQQGIE
jgi:hypothetical protein